MNAGIAARRRRLAQCSIGLTSEVHTERTDCREATCQAESISKGATAEHGLHRVNGDQHRPRTRNAPAPAPADMRFKGDSYHAREQR